MMATVLGAKVPFWMALLHLVATSASEQRISVEGQSTSASEFYVSSAKGKSVWFYFVIELITRGRISKTPAGLGLMSVQWLQF